MVCDDTSGLFLSLVFWPLLLSPLLRNRASPGFSHGLPFRFKLRVLPRKPTYRHSLRYHFYAEDFPFVCVTSLDFSPDLLTQTIWRLFSGHLPGPQPQPAGTSASICPRAVHSLLLKLKFLQGPQSRDPSRCLSQCLPSLLAGHASCPAVFDHSFPLRRHPSCLQLLPNWSPCCHSCPPPLHHPAGVLS